jgi:cell division septal protein FtsQ
VDTRRFHHPEYKKQISAVRHHKRRVVQKPEGKFGWLIHKLGLDSWKRRLFLLLLFGIFVYLTYFAAFMNLGPVEIKGAESVLAEEITQAYERQKQERLFYILPQKNILYFSSSQFKHKLISENLKVGKVERVNKRIVKGPSLEVRVWQRNPKYTLINQARHFVLNEDGVVGTEIIVLTEPEISAQQSSAEELITPQVINLADEEIQPGQTFLDQQKQSFLNKLDLEIAAILGSKPVRYEIPGKGSDQISVFVERGIRLDFNSTSDPAVYLERLRSLWQNLPPEQQAILDYVDLRFDPNAYLCYRTEKCARN